MGWFVKNFLYPTDKFISTISLQWNTKSMLHKILHTYLWWLSLPFNESNNITGIAVSQEFQFCFKLFSNFCKKKCTESEQRLFLKKARSFIHSIQCLKIKLRYRGAKKYKKTISSIQKARKNQYTKQNGIKLNMTI